MKTSDRNVLIAAAHGVAPSRSLTKAEQDIWTESQSCIIGIIEAQLEEKDLSVPVTEEMVTRFLNWPLPKSVRPDTCVMDTEYPHRVGTNLLTADEARKMLEHVLAHKE